MFQFFNHLDPLEQPDWEVELGRRTRADYLFTNDAKERARLTLQHNLFKLVMRGKLYCAPVQTLNRFLDVACGTGSWGLEVLQQHPEAAGDFLDLDRVLIMRLLESTSPERRAELPLDRVAFHLADARKRLPFDDNTFDFVHSRFPDVFLSEEGWNHFIEECLRVCKVGGWVEITAASMFQCKIPSVAGALLLAAQIRLVQAFDVVPNAGIYLKGRLERLGITPHTENHILGNGEVQRDMLFRDLKHILEETKPRLAQKNIMSEEEFDRLLSQLVADVPTHGLIWAFPRVWGQKQQSMVG